MNVIIYARYSSSKQKDTSIEAQLKECYEYCINNKSLINNCFYKMMTYKTYK